MVRPTKEYTQKEHADFMEFSDGYRAAQRGKPRQEHASLQWFKGWQMGLRDFPPSKVRRKERV